MLDISIDSESNQKGIEKPEKKSLKAYLLEKIRTWVNSLLEAERDEFLGRQRHEPVGEGGNYRNGYRPRTLNVLGIGEVELEVPRDCNGEFRSAWLPDRKRQDPGWRHFWLKRFLAGLSTRDPSRLSEKHLGHRYDSKQISRIVERATTDLEAWRCRRLEGRNYKFLYIDGANFRVRINGRVSGQSFCAVLGVSEQDECFECWR